MAVGHALDHIFEVGVGLDVVELCRGDEGADRAPSLCAAIGTGEKVVLAPERDGPDGALDRVVVELDAAVILGTITLLLHRIYRGEKIASGSLGTSVSEMDAYRTLTRIPCSTAKIP